MTSLVRLPARPGGSNVFTTGNSAGGGQAPFQPIHAAPPTAFVYDHGPNSYSPAGLTGTYQLSTPGLIPIFGGDDGALVLGTTGVVTYPTASALNGTTDFTIAGLAVLGGGDSCYLYNGGLGHPNALGFLIDGTGSIMRVTDLASLTVTVGNNDGRVHLYVLRRSAGSTLELFFDGTLVGSTTIAATATIDGATRGCSSTVVSGSATIDELAWWDRALTDNELDTLTQAASILTGSTGLLSGQWLQRHLADFAFSDADISTGSSVIDAPDLSTGDAAGALAQVAQAEDGMCFVDGAGRLRFIGRNDIGLSTATFGDGGGSELPFVEPPDWSYDWGHIYTQVQVTKAGSATVIANDTDSQNEYGRGGNRTLPVSADLLESSQLDDAANWFLARYKQPQLRVDRLVVRGQGGYWPTLLALELGDRVTVNHRPPGGTLLTADVIIEHIEHQRGVDGDGNPDWVVELQLAPCPNVFILGDPTHGVLGGGSFLGWGAPFPRKFILGDPVQGVLGAGYTLS